MKKTFILGLVVSLLALASCGEEEDNKDNGLLASVTGSAILFPFATTGCSSTDTVAESNFSIQNLNIVWTKKDANLIIAFIKIEATGSALASDFSAVLGGDDISEKIIYFDDSAKTIPKLISNGIIPAATDAVPERYMQPLAACSMKIGGVSISNTKNNFTLEATLTIQGIAVGIVPSSADVVGNLGQETPVKTKTKFKIVYNLN